MNQEVNEEELWHRREDERQRQQTSNKELKVYQCKKIAQTSMDNSRGTKKRG